MVNKKGGAGLVIGIIVFLLIVVLVWGFVGGQEAQKVGVTCDMGVGESLCWQWHKNLIGRTGEAINDIFGNR